LWSHLLLTINIKINSKNDLDKDSPQTAAAIAHT